VAGFKNSNNGDRAWPLLFEMNIYFESFHRLGKTPSVTRSRKINVLSQYVS